MKQVSVGKVMDAAKGSTVLVAGKPQVLTGSLPLLTTEPPLCRLNGIDCIKGVYADNPDRVVCLADREVIRPGKGTVIDVSASVLPARRAAFDFSIAPGTEVTVLPTTRIGAQE